MTTVGTDGRLLRGGVLISVLVAVVLPILGGLWETGRAGVGLLPAIGATEPSFAPWRALAQMPGLTTSLRLTLMTGLGATALSLILAVGFSATLHRRMSRRAGGRILTPFLAAPHAAMAIGLAFLISPSGWIARAFAPILGWDRPPMLATVNDPWGLALILGLVVKEVPFLLLVILSALSRSRCASTSHRGGRLAMAAALSGSSSSCRRSGP